MTLNKALLVVLSLSFFAITSNAQERHIHLNGIHLEPQQIQAMDQVFEQRVPDGFYWINDNTGQWGYEGDDTVQGIIPAALAAQSQPSHNHQQQSSGHHSNPNISMSQNGRVVSGHINGQHCTYVTVHGMSVRSCD